MRRSSWPVPAPNENDSTTPLRLGPMRCNNVLSEKIAYEAHDVTCRASSIRKSKSSSLELTEICRNAQHFSWRRHEGIYLENRLA